MNIVGITTLKMEPKAAFRVFAHPNTLYVPYEFAHIRAAKDYCHSAEELYSSLLTYPTHWTQALNCSKEELDAFVLRLKTELRGKVADELLDFVAPPKPAFAYGVGTPLSKETIEEVLRNDSNVFMDNFKVVVESHSSVHLKAALDIVCSGRYEIEYYAETNKKHDREWGGDVIVKMLELYWYISDSESQNSKRSTQSKYKKIEPPLNKDTIFQFINNWLKTATYPPEPDHDGSNSKGFLLERDEWGSHGKLLTITPTWAMHGK